MAIGKYKSLEPEGGGGVGFPVKPSHDYSGPLWLLGVCCDTDASLCRWLQLASLVRCKLLQALRGPCWPFGACWIFFIFGVDVEIRLHVPAMHVRQRLFCRRHLREAKESPEDLRQLKGYHVLGRPLKLAVAEPL